MTFLVTSKPKPQPVQTVQHDYAQLKHASALTATPHSTHGDFAEACAEAEMRARKGETEVCVWTLARTATVETKTVWQEYRAIDPVFAPEGVEVDEKEEA